MNCPDSRAVLNHSETWFSVQRSARRTYPGLGLAVLVIAMGAPGSTRGDDAAEIARLMKQLATSDREAAAAKLRRIGPPAVPALLDALDADGLTPRIAISVLGDIADPGAVEPLVHHLVNQPFPWQGHGADVALIKIGEPSVQPLMNALAVALEAPPSDSPALDRAKVTTVTRVLGEIGDPRAVALLSETLVRGVQTELPTLCNEELDTLLSATCAAMEALAQIGIPAVPSLLVLISHEQSKVRLAAVRVLYQIGDTGATKELIRATYDSSSSVAQAAAMALGACSDERATRALFAAAANGRVERRLLSTYGLEELIRREAVSKTHIVRATKLLGKALFDRDNGVRRRAAEVLVELDSPSARKALVNAAVKKNLVVVAAQFRYFIRIGNERTIPALLASFRNPVGIPKDKMGDVFLVCGHEKLYYAAREWFIGRGWKLESAQGAPPSRVEFQIQDPSRLARPPARVRVIQAGEPDFPRWGSGP